MVKHRSKPTKGMAKQDSHMLLNVSLYQLVAAVVVGSQAAAGMLLLFCCIAAASLRQQHWSPTLPPMVPPGDAAMV